jgi:hypothetical protein
LFWMQGQNIHISLWLTKKKTIAGLVVHFRLVDVMVPGVLYPSLRIGTVAVAFFGFKCLSLGLTAAVTTTIRNQTYHSANGLPEVAINQLISYFL